MKKSLISLTLLTVLVVWLSPRVLGFSLLHIGHAVAVSTNMSAKLACSSKFISGLNKSRIIKDLSSYSPVINLLNIEFEEAKQQVQTDLFGLASATAQYRQGVGCSLVSEQTTQMDGVSLDKLAQTEGKWPQGEEVELAPLLQESVEQLLRSDNERGYNTSALLVVKDGELLAEAYGPNITQDTPLLGWSMAKSATAILLGILERQQIVSREDKQLFAQWQEDERATLTLEQLLHMSSGLTFDETYEPGYDATHMLFTADSASDVALNSPLEREPGSFFYYSSGTSNLLSRYISAQFQMQPQAVQHFVQRALFIPLGMTNSMFEMDASGVMVGSSYLYASARDWARLGWLMVNDGEINGTRLLDKAWVRDAEQPNLSNNDKRYGYQLWLNSGMPEMRWPSLPADAYAMMGNRHQSVMMIPSKSLVFVRLGWTSGEYPMAQNYKKLLDQIQKP